MSTESLREVGAPCPHSLGCRTAAATRRSPRCDHRLVANADERCASGSLIDISGTSATDAVSLH